MRNALLSLATTLVVGVTLAVAACGGDATGPDQTRTDDALHFLHLAAGSPPIANPSVSFWAKAGQGGGIDMWFHAAAGRSDSSKFMEFRIGSNTLVTRPDGTPLARGDSIRITVTLTDPSKLILDFQPSGLRFSDRDLAEMKIFFGNCDDDLNGDGTVNGSDEALESQLAIWKRENVGDPWTRLSSLVVKGTKEVDAKIGGFTGYAISF